jgi:cytochrome c553
VAGRILFPKVIWNIMMRWVRGGVGLLGALLILQGGAPHAQNSEPPAPDLIKDKLVTCLACHGPGGVSQMEGAPNLAAAPDLYIEWQLVYFRGATRKNDMMTPAAADLTDDDIRNFGAYFAALPPPPAPATPDDDPALTKAGAKIVEERHCAQCHTPTFAGGGEAPRLAGQREEYLVKALHDYQHGARRGRGNVIMPEIAYALSEDDVNAIAHFMSRQPQK